MFSVIIPLYNKSTYITKSIQSVLDQTFTDFELIIVDDGSTDDGSDKVRQFTDHRIQLIDQTNGGVSSARNNGVNVAKYNYIAFLDADDWWDKNFLKEMKSLITKYPDAGIYGSKYYWVKNSKLKESINHESIDFEGYLDYFQAYAHAWWMPLTSISTVVKKSVLLELKGFKPNLKFGEDFDLWIRIALKYKIAYINKVLAFYNQDVEKKSRALGSKLWKPENHYIFNLDYLQPEEKRNPMLKELLDGMRVRALLRYYLAGKYKNETYIILNCIDFKKQSKFYNRVYYWPKGIVKIYFFLKKAGSLVKQQVIKYKSK